MDNEEKNVTFSIIKKIGGSGEIVQSTKCLLYKYGDLSLIPSTHIKTVGCGDLCNHNLQGQTEGLPGQQLRLPGKFQASERPVFEQHEKTRN